MVLGVGFWALPGIRGKGGRVRGKGSGVANEG